MYKFVIKDNKAEVEIIVSRVLLAIAGIAGLVSHTQEYYFVSIACAVILFIASYFVKIIVTKLKVDQLLLLSLAAIILFIATHSFLYAAGMLLYGIVLKFLRKKAVIEISGDGVTIKKLFTDQSEPWSSLSNVVLKDGLLTLDFINNKLLQLTIEDHSTPVDEKLFNEFCGQQLIA